MTDQSHIDAMRLVPIPRRVEATPDDVLEPGTYERDQVNQFKRALLEDLYRQQRDAFLDFERPKPPPKPQRVRFEPWRHSCWRRLVNREGYPIDTSTRAMAASDRWQRGDRGERDPECRGCMEGV